MDHSKYIHAGYLIDGSGGAIQKNVLLTVTAGKIARIEPFKLVDIPESGRLVDFSRYTITPPLVDSHVHLALSATVDKNVRARQLKAAYPEVASTIAGNIKHHLSQGILALRDGGDEHGYVLRYKREMGEELPILKVSGRAWHREGRYGSMLGRHPGEEESLAAAFAGEIDPIDQVKLINSGPNSLNEFGRQTPPQFTLDELRETIGLAHRRGLSVMVHANGVEPVRMAIEAGADSIEHGYFMGRENLARMAEKQVFWVPTIFAMQALTHKVIRISPPGERAVAARNVENQLLQVAWAKELGVPLAAGTDSGCHGVLHGEALLDEMKMLIKGGYSLPEVIQASSHNGARLLGLDDLGLIAGGRSADFLVVPGTPAQLPRKLAYLEAIYIGGAVVNLCRNR